MGTRWKASGAVLALVCFGVAGGVARAGSDRLTRGDLAIRAARAAGIALPAAGEDRAAAAALKKSGIDFGADLKAPVTQATLVELGKVVGVSVSTSKPQAPVSTAIGAAFVRSIQGPLQAAVAAQGGTTFVNASCKGRESRASREGTPASNANPNATAGPCEEPIP
jgi:hypothetical protein